MDYVGIGVAARRLGVSRGTLRRWDREAVFRPEGRTPGNHRLYSEKQIVAEVRRARVRAAVSGPARAIVL